MDPSREYEHKVMAGEADAEPPEGYEMSDAFRDWMVEQMRGEVLGQVSDAGLDRMAVVKAPDATETADDPGDGA